MNPYIDRLLQSPTVVVAIVLAITLLLSLAMIVFRDAIRERLADRPWYREALPLLVSPLVRAFHIVVEELTSGHSASVANGVSVLLVCGTAVAAFLHFFGLVVLPENEVTNNAGVALLASVFGAPIVAFLSDWLTNRARHQFMAARESSLVVRDE